MVWNSITCRPLRLFARWFSALALAALPGLAAAQSHGRGLELSYVEHSEQRCYQNCDGACTMAYYFGQMNPPQCLLTDDRAPYVRMRGQYGIWSRALGAAVDCDVLVRHYPQTVQNNADVLPADCVRRVTQGDRGTDPAVAGAAACATAVIDTGTRWIIRYRGANNSHYFQHGNYLCSPDRDQFMALGANFLEFFRCGANFSGCRPYPAYDGHLGTPLGPDAHGATQRWPVTEGPGGREIGIIVARM